MKTQHINHLAHFFDIPLFTNFLGAEDVDRVAHIRRLVQLDMLLHDLSEVFVRSHHEDFETVSRGFLGDRANYVVGLISIHLKNRDIESADDILDDGQAVAYILRHFLACALVFFEYLIAEGGCRCIKGYGYVCRLLFLQDFQECIRKAKNHRGVHPLGVDSWVLGKCKMGAINQRIGIQEEELGLDDTHGAKIGIRALQAFDLN